MVTSRYSFYISIKNKKRPKHLPFSWKLLSTNKLDNLKDIL